MSLILSSIALFIIALQIIKHYRERNKTTLVVLSDHCDECPFKVKDFKTTHSSFNNYFFRCSLKEKHYTFSSTEEMHKTCDVGKKIEITIQKQ